MSLDSAAHSGADFGSADLAARPFDALGLTYQRTYGQLPEQLAAIAWLTARLPAGARVLDIGSGTGRPTADLLTAAGFQVTGVDVSATMVELARAQVPEAVFEQVDVRAMADRDGHWDAVCAFFPLLQMDRADLDRTLARIARWLAPGGFFIFATVPFDAEAAEVDWMGHRIRATSYPAATYLDRLRAAGLEIVHHGLSVFQPDYPGTGAEEHLFVYARRPGGAAVPRHALIAPRPHPLAYRGPHDLPQDGWLALQERFYRADIAAVLAALAGNSRVADVGGGSGAVVRAIAARLGGCTTVEAHADRERSMQALRADGVRVLPGRAERLPLADASVDAAVATWLLHYTDDPRAAAGELARIVDRAHPAARVVLVQGAPDNEIVGLWNRVCAPLLGEPADHQGYLLSQAAEVLAGQGFADLAFQRVTVRVRFPEPGPQAKAAAAARVLADLWHAEAAGRDVLTAALRPALAEHFATGADSLRDDGVLLVARPRPAM